MHNYETLLTEQIPREKPWVPLLIVEDDRALLPIFDWIIRGVDPSVSYHWCSSFEQARESLRYNRYGLILSDFLLEEHGGNGYDVFELNAAQETPSDFILMSGLELDKICRFGETPPRLLAKPLNVEEVQGIVRGAVLNRDKPTAVVTKMPVML
jgi:response regulator of citrate/malate metabolism